MHQRRRETEIVVDLIVRQFLRLIAVSYIAKLEGGSCRFHFDIHEQGKDARQRCTIFDALAEQAFLEKDRDRSSGRSVLLVWVHSVASHSED